MPNVGWTGMMADVHREWDKQVGGSHYRKTAYQHWDLVLDIQMGYLEAQATRYLTRWWRKGNGVEDLRKAEHYISKLLSVQDRVHAPGYNILHFDKVLRFVMADDELANREGERLAILTLAMWRDEADLKFALSCVCDLIAYATTPVAKSKSVPLTEENHYAERATDRG